MTKPSSNIMTVLPPKEGFSQDCAGAIGLLVRRLAKPNDLIVGQSTASPPFKGLRYLEISLGWRRFLGKNRAYLYGIIRYIKQYQPVMVEIHNRPEIALSIAKKFPDIVVSLTLHNDPVGMRRAKIAAERQLLLQKLHVVTVSEFLKQRFLSDNVRGEVTVLSNSIDLRAVPSYIPIDHREKTILFVGRMVADKGADLFIQICQRILLIDPSWKIEMIGADRFFKNSQETSFIKQLRHQIKNDQVVMRGYLPHDEVLKRMATVKVIIIPSRWPEPFGMTALEAMACGTPLLVSSRGALPQIVGNAALIIDPEQIEDCVQQLLRLIQDKVLQEYLSQQALMQVQRYNVSDALAVLTSFRKQICPLLKAGIQIQEDH
ncbi:glycosyltransferase family 4 protein [Commensalibacter oyaizuii]|uniref:Glycosyltransferase family 4 protein n=1 Tax=Commensalibacter oyaizuii TaxID=3043873 RepID=A0ABT6Q521_9PROT|nr:glycosyltransferase family 4 protein [Commensalibacter sp. TBRC 16381]MDI2091574.1 glycosyltransferase family 4 protein [Commensalibacter sp. TBRC 16381]